MNGETINILERLQVFQTLNEALNTLGARVLTREEIETAFRLFTPKELAVLFQDISPEECMVLTKEQAKLLVRAGKRDEDFKRYGLPVLLLHCPGLENERVRALEGAYGDNAFKKTLRSEHTSKRLLEKYQDRIINAGRGARQQVSKNPNLPSSLIDKIVETSDYILVTANPNLEPRGYWPYKKFEAIRFRISLTQSELEERFDSFIRSTACGIRQDMFEALADSWTGTFDELIEACRELEK